MLVGAVTLLAFLVACTALMLTENATDMHSPDPPPPAPSPANPELPRSAGVVASDLGTADCASEVASNRSAAFVALSGVSSRLAPNLEVASQSERLGSCTPILKDLLKEHDKCQLKKLEQLEMAEFDAQHKRLFLSARLWYELFSEGALQCPEVQAKALKEIHGILRVLRWYEPQWHLAPCQRLAKAQAEYTQSRLRGDSQRRRLEELAAAVYGYNRHARAAHMPTEELPELPQSCAAQAAASVFTRQDGYVSKGDDLLVASMTVQEATARCATLLGCQAITFFVTDEVLKNPKETVVEVYFKEKQDVHGCKESGWQTYLRNTVTQRKYVTKGNFTDSRVLNAKAVQAILNAKEVLKNVPENLKGAQDVQTRENAEVIATTTTTAIPDV